MNKFRFFPFIMLVILCFPNQTFAQNTQYLLPDVETCSEEALVVEVTTRQFTEIVSAQFSIQWDTTHLHLDTILNPNPALILPLFNTSLIAEGRMAFSWLDDSFEGVTLANDATLFELHFQAQTVGGITAPFSFVNFPSPLETVKNINGSPMIVPSEGIDGHYSIYLPAVASVNIEASSNGMDGSIDLTVIGGKSPYTYLWSNGADTETIQNLPPATYFCTVTDDFNCQNILGPFQVDQLMSIDAFSNSQLKLWPNPIKDWLNLQLSFDQNQRGSIHLYDTQGTLLQDFRFRGQEWEQSIDLSVYPSGVYLLNIQIGQQSILRRLIKMPH